MSKSNENITITISGSISATKIQQITRILNNREYDYAMEKRQASGTKFKVVLALKEVIKKDNNKIKDNIPLTRLAWALCKENDYDLNGSIKSYKNDKVGFAKKYEEKVTIIKK